MLAACARSSSSMGAHQLAPSPQVLQFWGLARTTPASGPQSTAPGSADTLPGQGVAVLGEQTRQVVVRVHRAVLVSHRQNHIPCNRNDPRKSSGTKADIDRKRKPSTVWARALS